MRLRECYFIEKVIRITPLGLDDVTMGQGQLKTCAVDERKGCKVWRLELA